MKVCFVDTEEPEAAFFAERLGEMDLEFVDGLLEVPEDAEALSIFIYNRVDGEFLDRHPSLKLIATRSVSCDHIALGECRARGVAVVNVGDYGENSVAEHTMALILAVARNLRMAEKSRQSGRFAHSDLRGFELRGKTLGLIGAGRIGSRVARLARAFDMEVLACDPCEDSEKARKVGFSYGTLDEVLEKADIVSLHLPLTEESRHLLNAETLGKCRSGVVIINTARGGLIDTRALDAALESGQVSGAGLDVLEDERVLRMSAREIVGSEIVERVRGGREGSTQVLRDAHRHEELVILFVENALLEREEVVFTPHIAFNTHSAFEAINASTVESIEDFAAGRPLKHLIHG